MDVIAANDGRLPYQKIQRIRQLRPDMILLSGGVDGGTTRHVAELAELIAAADPKARLGTSYKLPIIYAGNIEAVPHLLPFLRSPDNRIRGNAILALWNLGEFKIVNELGKMLDDKAELQVLSGLYILGQIGLSLHVPRLETHPLLPIALRDYYQRKLAGRKDEESRKMDLFKISTEFERAQLQEVLEKGRDIWEKFEEMARELKKRPEMDWKKEQEIDRAIEKQKELADKVQEISEEMKKELDRMEEQQLVSQEVAEKMEAIRELMEQVESETMREYMEQQRKAG